MFIGASPGATAASPPVGPGECPLCGRGGKGLVAAPAVLQFVSSQEGALWRGIEESLRPSGYGLTLPAQLIAMQVRRRTPLTPQMGSRHSAAAPLKPRWSCGALGNNDNRRRKRRGCCRRCGRGGRPCALSWPSRRSEGAKTRGARAEGRWHGWVKWRRRSRRGTC